MISPKPHAPGPARSPAWSSRWSQLAHAAGIRAEEPLLLALSGGADSVLLLHLIASAEERPPLRALHVNHGLRGTESDEDARFCRQLCASLDVPFREEQVQLDPESGSLEERARQARYRALCREASRTGFHTILTGHHSDDALETLLMRWIRGTPLSGLRGARGRQPAGSYMRGEPEPGSTADTGDESPELIVVRPLLHLRREEVRRLLTDRGVGWREDSSNRSMQHTRNRLRHRFLPFLEEVGGASGIENLRAFGRAVESLEDRLASATAHLAWKPATYARASRGLNDRRLGGMLPRRELMRLSKPLRRRALWRLTVEGIGKAPRRAVLEMILSDLEEGRCSRYALRAGWMLVLRSSALHLLPPDTTPSETPEFAEEGLLPFPAPRSRNPEARAPSALVLSVPGIVSLPDGRRISAERVRVRPSAPPPANGMQVELDAAGLPERLGVRWPGRGDRFHALGAPGSKGLRRFLADRDVPREERGRIPLVVAGAEILWVVGVEPGERHRLREHLQGSGGERLRLTLHDC